MLVLLLFAMFCPFVPSVPSVPFVQYLCMSRNTISHAFRQHFLGVSQPVAWSSGTDSAQRMTVMHASLCNGKSPDCSSVANRENQLTKKEAVGGIGRKKREELEVIPTLLLCDVTEKRPRHQCQPIQLRNMVMTPVLSRSTNMAPMIGTSRKGFTL